MSDRAREQLERLIPVRLGKPTFPPTGKGDYPPDGWTVPDRPGTRFADAERPVEDGKLNTVILDVSGDDAEHMVVEVAGVKVPKLLAVSWGRSPTPRPSRRLLEVQALMFRRAGVNTAPAALGGSRWPRSAPATTC